MTNRELLESAAKAAGVFCRGWCLPGARLDGWHGMYTGDPDEGSYVRWNPLKDDGDALRLAVKLKLEVGVWFDTTRVESDEAESAVEKHLADPYAATRRAIVRAAAEIGRSRN